ncbi:hypothetical protein BC830DRAFT_1115374, partial [Chytriomyces sp. MP71]
MVNSKVTSTLVCSRDGDDAGADGSRLPTKSQGGTRSPSRVPPFSRMLARTLSLQKKTELESRMYAQPQSQPQYAGGYQQPGYQPPMQAQPQVVYVQQPAVSSTAQPIPGGVSKHLLASSQQPKRGGAGAGAGFCFGLLACCALEECACCACEEVCNVSTTFGVQALASFAVVSSVSSPVKKVAFDSAAAESLVHPVRGFG